MCDTSTYDAECQRPVTQMIHKFLENVTRDVGVDDRVEENASNYAGT
jgi:hypothetical protein